MEQADKANNTIIGINLITALADVLDSIIVDINEGSRIIGQQLRFEKRRNYNMLVDACRTVKIRARNVSADGYAINDAQDFIEDSDLIYKLLWTLAKTNASRNAIEQIINNLEQGT